MNKYVGVMKVVKPGIVWKSVGRLNGDAGGYWGVAHCRDEPLPLGGVV
ncbi:MAG: hypothetical protein KME26_32585 [Oscillatoria princeps RMCB-10]|nr:hypothetical protein [Oscillatoria princeps RMCB-10]